MKFRVKEICKEKGITMEQLAQDIGIARVNLTKCLNGNPTVQTLKKIASSLDVPLTELFERHSSGNFTCPNCGASLKLTA